MSKKILKSLPIILVLVLLVSISISKASTNTINLKGYAWSENIGWLSFNSANLVTASNAEEDDAATYAVTMSTTTGSSIATLGGTAWSENIGWVSFDRSNTGNPPQNDIGSGTGPIAQFNTNTGKVEGWARALAGDSSGTTLPALSYSTTTMVLNGQTGSMDQDIIITNNTSGTISAVRATILTPSPTYSSPTYSGITVPLNPYYLVANPNTGCSYQPLSPFSPIYEYGIDSSGRYFIQSNFPLGPGQSVTIHAMYYSGCRVYTNIAYSVSPAIKIPEPVIPAGAIQLINGVSATSNTTLLGHPVNVTWFANAVNTAYTYPTTHNSYAFQYSDDSGSTWHTAYGNNNGPVFVTAKAGSANQSQIVDFGVSQTNSPVLASRLYKIFAFPSGNYGQSDPDTYSLPNVVSSSSGWDGWISLSSTTQYTSPTPSGNGGVTFASTTGSFNGFAWGSDVVGWLDFRLVSCGTDCGGTPPVTPTNLSGTCSNSIDTAAETVTWTINPSGGNDTYRYKWNSASQSTVGTYTKPYSLVDTSVTAPTITLYDTASPQASLVITCIDVAVNGAITGGTGKMWLNNDPAKSLNVIKILTGRTTKVNWELPPIADGYTCNRINTTKILPEWVQNDVTADSPNGTNAYVTEPIPTKDIYDIDIQCTRASPAPMSINLGPVKIIVTDTILGEN
jgi:hypothetical protein